MGGAVAVNTSDSSNNTKLDGKDFPRRWKLEAVAEEEDKEPLSKPQTPQVLVVVGGFVVVEELSILLSKSLLTFN